MWLDYTKFGKLTGGELNDTCSLMASILARKPTKSAGIIIAPFLVSDRVSGGSRGEIRRGVGEKLILAIPTLK